MTKHTQNSQAVQWPDTQSLLSDTCMIRTLSTAHRAVSFPSAHSCPAPAGRDSAVPACSDTHHHPCFTSWKSACSQFLKLIQDRSCKCLDWWEKQYPKQAPSKLPVARGGLSHAEAQFSSVPPCAPSSCSWSLPLSCPRWSLCMWLRGKRTSCWKWYLGTMSQGTWEGRKNRNVWEDRAHVSMQWHGKHAKMLLNRKQAATSLNASYWNCRPMCSTQDWGREAALLKGPSSAKTYSQGALPRVKKTLLLCY